MSLRVVVVPDAQEQISEINHWWRANRPLARRLFEDELDRLLALLAEMPNIGEEYRQRGIPGLRKRRVNKTPYAVYYVSNDKSGVLHVIGVGSLMRKKRPPLRKP